MVLRLPKNRCFDPTILIGFGGCSAVCLRLDSSLPDLDFRCLVGGRLREMVGYRENFRGQFQRRGTAFGQAAARHP